MKYKALISDIDGTLTKRITTKVHRPLPSERVTKAVHEANKKIPIVLATSRPIQLVTYLLDFLKLHAPCVTLDGALIVDALSREILLETPIRNEDFDFVVNYLELANHPFIVDEKDKNDIPYTKDYHFKNPLNMFAFELSEKDAKKIEADFQKRSSINTHKVTSWTDSLWGINITNSNVSKQHAVIEVANLLNILPEEIIGVGDGYNDFSLLEACGLKVAMGNAVPELKAIADYIAPSVDEDGVADVIEKFVLSP